MKCKNEQSAMYFLTDCMDAQAGLAVMVKHLHKCQEHSKC